MAFKKPEPKPEFAKLEEEVSKFWQENEIFKKSVENRKDGESWRFYDGPPFISGTPHFGHMKDFVVKDAIPRYWTMKGYYAPRVWGWDCHGLPIENKVEKKLGIKSKLEVEQLGVAKYIEECYEYTRATSAEWTWYIEKMGRWIDYDHAYRTMDQDYMETVWWVFKNLWDKDLIYKGWRSSLYSTDSATPVSNFEIAMDNTYEDVLDDAVTVKFQVKKDDKFNQVFTGVEMKDYPVSFLSWTTTPWTLPSNFALAVNPDEDYALIETSTDNAKFEGKWLFEQAPFDFDKFQKEKIEEYYLSFQEEKVESKELLERSNREELDELTSLELKAVKKGKKFYYSENDILSEIDQQEFQKLVKLAKPEPIVKERVYFKQREQEDKKQTTLNIDFFKNKYEGLQFVSVEFNSPREYQSFIANLPEWFGKEVTGAEILRPENMTANELAGINQELSTYEQPKNEINNDEFGQYVIMALKLAESVIKGDFQVITTMKGKDIAGLSYEQIYNFFKAGKNDHKVYMEGIVTVEDGTGVLHVAPAFGEEDFEIGKKHNLSFIQCIDDAGVLLPETGKFAGMYLRNAALPIINDLAEQGVLYKAEKYTHRLPFFRYENPLIYRAQESWFINIQKIKNDLFAQNENINWVPDHLKTGRFRKGIETAPDWSISRSRFWATSMPVWIVTDEKNPDQTKENYSTDEIIVIGSRDELRSMSKDPITKIIFKVTEPVKSTMIPEGLESNIKELKEKFTEFLKQEPGKESDYNISAHELALLKHIFEGRSLEESFASVYDNPNNYTMYFLGTELLNLHRNVMDKVRLVNPETKKEYKRAPEVLDNWMESGAMPYAQIHYPFENEKEFEQSFPADYIVEYIAQTRAWFYVMHVLSVALTGKNSFKNAVTTGVIAGTDGRKMSKTYGNYPDPKLTLEKYGAEAVRWYFITSKLIVGEDIKIDEKEIRDQLRLYILPLWNIYSFFVTYAQLHGWKPNENLLINKPESGNHLDQWIIAKLQKTIHEMRADLDSYIIPKATRNLQDFVDLLSRSYIRRSRDRFNKGDIEAFDTLYYVLVEVIKLSAPFTPFISENIYLNLVKNEMNGQLESVHLADYPEADMDYLEKNALLLEQMDIVQKVIDLGLSIRTQNNLKLRQPLGEIEIKVNLDSNQDNEMKQWMKDMIATELNLLSVQEKHELIENKGWIMQKNDEGNIEISLNTNLTAELESQGLYRELVRFIQAKRKQKGLAMSDKARITIHTNSAKLKELVKNEVLKLAGDVNAEKLETSELQEGGEEIIKINNIDTFIELS